MRVLSILLFTLLFYGHAVSQNIYRTACQGNLTRLDSMLQNTSIQAKDSRGRSLLHWAVACKKKEVFDLLTKRGIHINTIDQQQRTPLHVALQFNNEDYVDLLVKLQPNNRWKTKYGASLLELAVLNRNKALLKKLVSLGVDINSVNERGSTPLEISKRIGPEDLSEFILSLGADKNLVRSFQLKGSYMGLKVPGKKPIMFAPNFISTEEEEFGSVFNAKGTEFYYAVHRKGNNEIRFSKMDGNIWTKPVTILSDKRYTYNDPFLSNDEKRLYFISKRAMDGKGKLKDVDIWYVESTEKGWSEPINAGTNINTNGNEYYISFTNDGTMYFSSNGHGSKKNGKNANYDIYYSKSVDGKFQKPVVLGDAINTSSYEADVFIAPDESYIIFCSTREGGFGRGDLYISFKGSDGNWSQAINMGNAINTNHYEYCPFVTKDGKYLFYTSNQDIYWVSTKIIQELKQK